MKLFVTYFGAAALATASLVAHGQTAQPDLTKGAATYGQVCVACHAADGNSSIPINPKLAQQHPEYLVKQLQEFKSGKRENAVMVGFASTLSDEDMRNVAYWLASQKATPGAASHGQRERQAIVKRTTGGKAVRLIDNDAAHRQFQAKSQDVGVVLRVNADRMTSALVDIDVADALTGRVEILRPPPRWPP